MEKIQQPFSSDPNSRDTSPTSRDVVVDNSNNNNNNSSFDEPHSATATYKVKFICSYGGKIHPRPHDNHLSYVGGDTKILAVDRNIKYSAFMTKVSSLANNANLCFKYQLPGEDLDALISVTNDEDLDNMMIEYDRVSRASPTKPARMRLILFPLINNAVSGSSPVQNFGPTEPKPERQWFVDALNSVQIPNLERSSPPQNPDFLFGFDKVYPKPPDPAPSPKDSDFAAKDSECGPEERKAVEENDAAAVASNQKQIQEELQKMQIANNNNEQQQQQQQQQQVLLHQLNEENVVDCYTQKNPEKVTPLPANSHLQVHPGPVHASFLPSSGYPEQVYLIQTASGLYQAIRPVTVTAAPLGPTYYAMPRMVPASSIAGAGLAYNGGSQVGVVNENGYSQVGVQHLPERSVGWN
ncbi:hypothetical protein TanjilG_08400 [Lupinus angustifolius]|uniref:PB1 domain-containing protein n=1 Tax=Lupinus angustifolius TaxID=3871 RepID=A0A1J7IUX7_LUPAN|nr:PREDICTED: uncharacterized protein LOC109338577 [Lupinus angustifolius]OIW16543.1 hypothetical protein TanjilG_08400 [Lupinus angustifolius]